MMKLKKESLIEFGVKNTNERIYKSEDFTRIRSYEQYCDAHDCYETIEYTLIDRFNVKASKGEVLGEVGFGGNEINLSNVTHRIDKIYIEGDILYGDISIIKFPIKHKHGKFIYSLDNFVFRSRGFGGVNHSSRVVSLERLLTFDASLKSNDTYPNMTNPNRDKKRILLVEKKFF